MDQLERIVAEIAAAAKADGRLPSAPRLSSSDRHPVHLTLRRDGRRLTSAWHENATIDEAVAAELSRHADADAIEISVAGLRSRLDTARFLRASCNAWRGLYGIELRVPGKGVYRLPPLEILTRNLNPARAVAKLAEMAGINEDQVTALWQFRADEFLLDLTKGRATRLFRGQVLVNQSDITRESVAAMAQAMGDWLVRQVGKDGKTAYKYWPSRGTYSDANNMIRQFMASACLALAARRGNVPAKGAMVRNFSYNFHTFYVEKSAFAVIEEEGKIKLGAAGVALQAILNLEDGAAYAHHLERLRAFVESMQNADGSFRTFLEPPWRTDGENFYPGEAMLALAMLHDRKPEPDLQDRLWRGFQFYRRWHLENRNPAFVPWHTQALCLFHRSVQASEIADFVFEMNDWLLGLQQGPEAPPDVQGEFFDPARPEFGPPHASATGVYMEGLIEAWSLARHLGETRRAEAYRKALLRGTRSLRQLQYRDDVSMFYLHRKQRVEGALRTSVFNNELRIDNVQHGLMALWKMLDRFGAGEFAA